MGISSGSGGAAVGVAAIATAATATPANTKPATTIEAPKRFFASPSDPEVKSPNMILNPRADSRRCVTDRS